MQGTDKKTKELTMLAILVALVIVLQTVSNYVSVGVVKITLTLVPIVIGGILLGPKAGAILGGSFGLIVAFFVITGLDAWSHDSMFVYRPFVTIILCILKGTLAGFVPALIYKAMPKKHPVLSSFVAAVSAPLVNTAVFLAGVLLFYREKFTEWGSEQFANIFLFLIIGFCGLNFIFEFTTSAVLSPAITTIVRAARKSR